MIKTYVTFSDKEIDTLRNCINKPFKKYRADPIEQAPWVWERVALYIDDKIYLLRNEIEAIEFFDFGLEDVSKLHFENVEESEVHSGLVGVQQVDTNINDRIKRIYLINEKQTRFQDDVPVSEMYFTKGIVFETDLRQYSFMKEDWDFEVHIELDRGSNVIDKLLSNYEKEDREDMDTGCLYVTERTVEEIK